MYSLKGILQSGFFILALSAGTLLAGEKAGVSFTRIGMLSVGGGMYTGQTFGDDLAAEGIPDASRYFGTFGFAGRTQVNRFITSGELQAVMSRNRSSGGLTSDIGAGYGLFNAGFDLVASDAISLYPLLGMGGGVVSLQVRPEEQTFGQYLQNTAYAGSIHQGTFLLHAGAAFDAAVGRDRPRGPVWLGLRAGYIFDPRESDVWYQDRVKITDGPRASLGGVYAKLTVGREKRRYQTRERCGAMKGECETAKPE